MSILKLIYDVEHSSWNVNSTEIGHDNNEIQVWFLVPGNASHDISNLKFCFELTCAAVEILKVQYPIPPIKYESIKSSLLGATVIELVPNTEYNIRVYTHTLDSGEIITTTACDFITAKPPQQFASWTWSDIEHAWMPPIPHPDPAIFLNTRPNQKLYQWSEKRLNWIEGLPEEVLAQDNTY